MIMNYKGTGSGTSIVNSVGGKMCIFEVRLMI